MIFRFENNSLIIFKRKSVDGSVIEFKPLAQKNFILGNEEKLANLIAKPLPIILMKSQNEKGIRQEGTMDKII